MLLKLQQHKDNDDKVKFLSLPSMKMPQKSLSILVFNGFMIYLFILPVW